MLDPDLSLDLLAAEGKLTADNLVDRLDAAVPYCPGWTGRDLAVHLAGVYRWVNAMVSDRMGEPPNKDLRAGLFADPDPFDDAGVQDRLHRALAGVVGSLRAAPTDAPIWTIWPADNARDFWIRRQLHETLVHRVDAQNTGRAETDAVSGAELDSLVAADGVDEMMLGFARRYRRLRNSEPIALAFQATDVERAWWAVIGPDDLVTGAGAPIRPADATVRAHSGELLLWLWNRRSSAGLHVSGNPAVLGVWTTHAHL